MKTCFFAVLGIVALLFASVAQAQTSFTMQGSYSTGSLGTPGKPGGTYRPQPLQQPTVKKVGPPKCTDKGHFDAKLGLCVANEITRIDMPEAHREYLRNCTGTIQTRVIPRDGVLVEQQRCVP